MSYKVLRTSEDVSSKQIEEAKNLRRVFTSAHAGIQFFVLAKQFLNKADCIGYLHQQKLDKNKDKKAIEEALKYTLDQKELLLSKMYELCVHHTESYMLGKGKTKGNKNGKIKKKG